MNSLQQIVAFTGVAGNAGIRSGQPLRRASMRAVVSIVPLLNSTQQNSMQAMIVGLQALPPISLEAQLVGEASGQARFGPLLHVQSSGGVVLETVLNYYLAGQLLRLIYAGFINGFEVKPETPELQFEFDAPGAYQAVVTRTGITSTGVTVLEKRLNFTVTPAPAPAPQAPPPAQRPPQSPQPPAVTCGAELDLDQPGSGGITGVRIFGAGFLSMEPVDIIESGAVAATTQADQFGRYSVHISELTGQPPTLHTFHAHGQTSGRTSNDAGFTV